MTYRISRLEGEIGMYLALTGKRLDTTDILRAGLATHMIPIDAIGRFEQETSA
jgi:enoyl-CoA hydratase/carnithine racemase